MLINHVKFKVVDTLALNWKWTMPIQNWNITLSQLVIFFEGRLDAVLDL